MITIYTVDAMGVYAAPREVDPFAAMPRGSMAPPPAVTPPQVAQWSGNQWAVLDAYPEPAPPAVKVPESVTQRQARLMLHRQGVLAGVDAVIDAMPEPAKTEARIEWEYASAIVRTSPLVAAMGAALSLDDAGLDALFIAAAAL